MLNAVRKLWKRPEAEIRFIAKGGRLASLTDHAPHLPIHDVIEQRAQRTNAHGPQPLWDGYKALERYARSTSEARTSDQVRTQPAIGRLYTWLAQQHAAPTIVEFGTAFGISGMYWLAGIGNGHLYTFEPNHTWAGFARENLSAISSRFTLTEETFETAGPRMLAPGSVQLAFVDAIHTGEFVRAQFAILRPLMASGGLVLFDDVQFSDDMRACWQQIATDPTLVASATVAECVGMIEVP